MVGEEHKRRTKFEKFWKEKKQLENKQLQRKEGVEKEIQR